MANTVNHEKLNELKELMGDAFNMLIETYITDSSNIITNLRKEKSSNNAAEVHRLAHSLKSSSANLGAQNISDIAKQLELEAKEGNLANADGYINQIEKLHPAVSGELRQAMG